ncbi:uncharacterized protein LOC120273228 [Dioscorea cayenensis subsp. rotundata]|uniref:Uncharacterized protein LOC120273228 n=1 Tax=Dioscorea cayennensis subsp. rotundata TaxID=55577 RepID=A0AB40CAJ3_DIOCR|nr:uncharacterized protein LOC120273228 [Dioscorea cayenensis subsp. rotundata]
MDPEAGNTQSSSCSSGNVRLKTDPAWDHFNVSNNAQGKKIFSCLYCGSKYQGGGINRMKYHLACIRGNIAACKKVPDDVRKQMAGFLTSSKQNEKDSFDDAYEEVEEDDVQEFSSLMKSQQKTTTIEKSLGKRKAKDSIEKFMVPRTTPESQPGNQECICEQTSNSGRRIWLLHGGFMIHAFHLMH